MALDLIDQAEQYSIYRDTAGLGNRKRLVLSLHDVRYRDQYGLHSVVEALAVDGTEGFARKLDTARHILRLAEDGTRRWYPRRNHLDEYVTFGRPQYYTGTGWADLPIGNPTTIANGYIEWDRTNFTLRYIHNWHFSKVEVVLKNNTAARRVRWPVSLTGLTWNAWNLLSGSQIVATVNPPFAVEGSTSNSGGKVYDVNTSYASGYVEFNATLTGATFPVTIDPTLVSQPDAAGTDVFLDESGPGSYFNATEYMAVRQLATIRDHSLIKFVLDPPLKTSYTIVSAILTLFMYEQSAQTFNLVINPIHANNDGWIETCKWNAKTNGASYWAGDVAHNGGSDAGCSVAGTDYVNTTMGAFTCTANAPVNTQYDITLDNDLFKTMIGANYGMIIRSTTNSVNPYPAKKFMTGDYNTDASKRPILTVDYISALHKSKLLIKGVT